MDGGTQIQAREERPAHDVGIDVLNRLHISDSTTDRRTGANFVQLYPRLFFLSEGGFKQSAQEHSVQ